ncbi:hypothetical protein DPV73_08425 [Leptospira mayottensis]|nr:hypothetical protein DPV73_08425 [Leptospira mayottensis]
MYGHNAVLEFFLYNKNYFKDSVTRNTNFAVFGRNSGQCFFLNQYLENAASSKRFGMKYLDSSSFLKSILSNKQEKDLLGFSDCLRGN